ncbi:MAG: hypothetical protein M1837_003633 [Sclerophora amabilis]|nr:MAG: hypothetical protein M1837_003633 [Sclerophora amabilis]
MATVDSQFPAEQEAWTIENLEDASEQLKRMHIQLRELRVTIPKLIQPLTTLYRSPEELFIDFSLSATVAAKDVKAYSQYMTSAASRSVLEYASASRKNNQTGIRPWVVTEHPHWLEWEEKDNGSDGKTTELGGENASDVDDSTLGMGDSDAVEQAVLGFKEAHPKFDINFNKMEKSINCVLQVPTLHLRIQEGTSSLGKSILQVTCKGTTHLAAAIERSIAARRKPLDDLKSLLDLIAAYTDIKSRRCIKCEKLLNGSPPQLPAIRQRIASKSSEGKELDMWDALHEGCV